MLALLLGLLVFARPPAAAKRFPNGAAKKFPNASGTVYVIRHGEKNRGETICTNKCRTGQELNEKGQARAKYIATLFDGDPFPRPKVLFANLKFATNSVQTIQPLADKLGLPIDSTHSWMHEWRSAEAILEALEKTGGPVLVAWEHKHVHNLVEDFGIRKSEVPQKWNPRDYDTIYRLDFHSHGKVDLSFGTEGFEQHFASKDTVFI